MTDLCSGLSDLFRIKNAQSRSFSPENPTGEKGKGAMEEPRPDMCCSELGKGWKVRPCITVSPSQVYTIVDTDGPGCINHIWMTCLVQNEPNILPWLAPTAKWRDIILRIYWDGQEQPSVECPIGDFFACGWGQYAQVSSLAVCVNPGSAFNSYWQMPFKKRCIITIENRWKYPATLFYQIDCTFSDIPGDVGYFHAQFRRTNPTPTKVPHIILDGVQGKGQYVGTYMCWGSNSTGWWGEGEVKFYLDGDTEYPTICGTGTEDYFCGSYNFENAATKQYQTFCTPYSGMPQVLRPNGVYQSQTRFGLYRWHIVDPVFFDHSIKVDIQALGWASDFKYKALNDDIASTAFWYQTLPTSPFPQLPDRSFLEVI